MEEIQKTEIHYVEKNSSIYPARLRELSGMPKQLYYIGRFPEDNKPTAAIVGARLCSAYGRIQAFRYGKFLSEHGVQVISGMAAGIDAEGHKGALEGGQDAVISDPLFSFASTTSTRSASPLMIRFLAGK